MIEKLHRDERETLIIFNEADNEYIIETTIFAHIRKFDKLGYEVVKEQKYSDGTIMSKEYKVPKFAITFRKPVKRVVSEEQKKELAERLKNTHKNK